MGVLDRRWELVLRLLFLALCACLYGWWAVSIPFAGYGTTPNYIDLVGPDENLRVQLLDWIVQHGTLPLGSEPELIANNWGFSYGFTVYGSTLASIPAAIVSDVVTGGSPLAIVLAARITDVALSVATLWFCFCCSDRLFGLAATRFLFVGLIAFLPQYGFLSSYLNCEVIELFSVALCSFAILRGIERGWGVGDCCILGVGLGVCALSYYFAYAMFPVSVIAYYATIGGVRARGQGLRPVRDLLLLPLLIAGVAFAVCGWFFIRNLVIHGDFFGMRAMNESGELHAIDKLKPSQRVTPRTEGVGPLEMVLYGWSGWPEPWIEIVYKSAIGAFGMMKIFLSTGVYLAYTAVLGVGFVAGIVRLVVQGVTGVHRPPHLALLAVSLVLMVVIPFVLSTYYSWTVDYQAQGRYVIAAMPALMFVVAYGYGLGRWAVDDGGVAVTTGDGGAHLRRAGRSREAAVEVAAAPADGEPRADRHAPCKRLWSGLSLAVLGLWAALFVYVLVTVIVPVATSPLFG